MRWCEWSAHCSTGASSPRLTLADTAGEAFVKHHIKAVDRLLGIPLLHPERHTIYAALAKTVLECIERSVILVD